MEKLTGKSALESIINQHASNIFALAVSISGDRLDAEDIMQNVFYKLARHIKEVKRKDKISRWIISATYREALKFLKNKKRNIKTFQDRAKTGGSDSEWLFVDKLKLPGEALLDDDLNEQVNSVVQDIPIKYRMPLLLHRVHGLSLAQSSDVLGVNATTTKARLERAYRLFREGIAGYLNGSQPEKTTTRLDSACGAWTDFIDEYAAGKLERKRRVSFEKHIRDCGDCASFLDSYKKAIRLTGALVCRDISPELRKKVETFLTGMKK